MQGLRLGRTARRTLARLTRACAVALEMFATRVEPGRVRPSTAVPADQPPQHWLEDIQRSGGALDWMRFSTRERARPMYPRERRQTAAAAPRPVRPQFVEERASPPSLNDAAPTRLRFTIRPQPVSIPPRARPATRSAAEPRVTLRFAPRPAQPASVAIQRRVTSGEHEHAASLQPYRLATAEVAEHRSMGGHTEAWPPFTLDTLVPEDLFPDWPAAGTERSPAQQATVPGGAQTRPEPATSATPSRWEPLTWPPMSTQPGRPISDTDVSSRQAAPVQQPWPALPDSAPNAASSERAAWEWARGRREEQHLRRLEHEQRGAPWSESLS